jgi:hypothetical protein
MSHKETQTEREICIVRVLDTTEDLSVPKADSHKFPVGQVPDGHL